MTVKIAFFDTKPYDRTFFDEVNKEFGFRIRYFKYHLNEDTAALAYGYDVVCIFVNDVVNEKAMEILKTSGVKLIALRCAGYNNVDIKAATAVDIPIVRVPSYSPFAVAEHAVGLMLTLNRHIHKAYVRTREHDFTITGFLGFDMRGKTVGVVGTGRIGRAIISILKGFGMTVLAYDPFPDPEYASNTGIKMTTLDEIYEKSDIITLHCPLTPETHHLISELSIAKMKSKVMIINTSRGALINTKALIKGLKAKKIGAAGLDVYEEEGDYFFEDYSQNVMTDDVLARLLTFPNVVVTSHQAFFTREALHNIAERTLLNVSRYILEHKLENKVFL